MPPRAPRDETRLNEQRRMGARIRRAREENKLTQLELANRLGFSTAWVSAIENGAQGIDVLDLQRISDITRYPLAFFTDADFRPGVMKTPQTRLDWIAAFPDDPDRADFHWKQDELIARLMEAKPRRDSATAHDATRRP